MAADLRRATPADIPAIAELRLSVGWQVHDWALHDAMRPPHAAVFVIEEAGRILAVGSGIAYGQLGIVGNMVVAADHRRAGLGSRVMEAVLDFLASREVTRLELFATAQGRPLYERFGFEALTAGTMVEIDTATGRGAAASARGVEVRSAGPADLPPVAAYDLPRYGADRSRVLETALADAGRPSLLALRAGQLVGFTVFRPSGGRLGPWVADDPEAAAALLAAVAAVPSAGAVLAANLPGENEAGRAWLTGIGAQVRWTDGRMARGAAIERRLETIYGNVIGALG